MPGTGRVSPWLLRDADGKGELDWAPPARIAESDDVLAAASLAAHGIRARQSDDLIVRERIERGELVELLPQLGGRTRGAALYAGQRPPSASTHSNASA